MCELLDAASQWLTSQPGMRPWARGRQRLLAQVGRWIARYGTAACGRRLHTAEPLYAACAARLWRCWEYHWRQAAELAGGRVDGFQVAARLEQGLGFCGKGQLGGNPLQDVVLAAAVLQREPVAIERFSERFRDRALALARKTNPRISDLEDWWSQLMVHLAGVGCVAGKLAKYGGRCGLWNWLARVVINFSRDRPKPLPSHSGVLESIPAPPTSLAEDRDCLELLGGLVRQAIEQLAAEQATLLYLLYVERLSGKEVAAILGVHPGTISRRTEKAIKHFHKALASFELSSLHGQGYRECLETLSHARNLRELADVFLSALARSPEATIGLAQEPDA